jgi:CubicO group peptidase (beta-lactamase class C family)
MLKRLLLSGLMLMLGLVRFASTEAIEPGATPPPVPAGTTEPKPAMPTAPASLDDLPELTAFFDGAMRVGMEEHHVTGAVVAVVKDGRVLFAKGYGNGDLASNTPIDPATSLFRIGSTTKTLTWTAVMQLVEEGKLDLDTDVNAYLKGVKIPDTYSKPVTLRTIMTHTTGFEEGFLGYLIQTDPKAQVSIAQAMQQHMPERVRPPGAMSAYSNYGAALAGLIVEQVSGIPFNDYIEQKIFAPLGMHYATVQEPVPERLKHDLTTGYKFENGAEEAQPYEIVGGFRPAGSGAVSALDMTHFMLAHLQEGRYEGRQILKPETAQLMHATAFAPDPRFPGMALGFYHQNVNGNDAFGHGGDTTLYHTDMLLFPKQNVGLFLSFITQDNRIRERVEEAFFARYFPPAAARPGRIPDVEARALAGRYSGSYQWTRRNHSDIEKLFNLFSSLNVAPLPSGNLIVSGLAPDPLQFEPIANELYREVLHGDLKISFRTDASGHPTHLFLSEFPFMPTERTPWYEQSSTWYALLAAVFLVFLGTLVSTYYRLREIRAMVIPQRRAIWIASGVAGWAWATVLVLGGVVLATGFDNLFERIPSSLSVALVMPLVLVGLSVWLAAVTWQVWRGRFWSASRRIGYSLTALAALVLCLFFWQWNLLGWHYG